MVFVLITATSTYDIEKRCLIVGGVQTYTRDLCLLAIEKGFHAIMYQLDEEHDDSQAIFDGIEFHIVRKKGHNNQRSFDSIYKAYNSDDSIFVIATDQMNIKTKASNVIVIQHGIAFDITSVPGFWGKTFFLQHVNKALRCINNVRRLYWCRNTVGVDYNYFNWFRTLGIIPPGKKYVVIPNYSSGQISESEMARKIRNKNSLIRIVFARRFTSYRGVHLFAKCVDRLLNEYSNLDFTFAGEGELKREIEFRYMNNPRVHITSFSAPDSIIFHKQYDIAVVPTIFSEGTSLSLLEAMSAGCFPIATHVGGMTNIIIDHFNGLLCFPDEKGVYDAIKEAISMEDDKYKSIIVNAYHSAVEAFSIGQWKRRWWTFIDDVMNNKLDNN